MSILISKFKSLVFLTLLICISCTTTAEKKTENLYENNAEISVNDKSEILKNFDFPEAVWNLANNDGYIYFTGISPFYLDDKKSDEILLKDASESAAIYDSVFGFSGQITEKSSLGTRRGSSFNYIYSNQSLYYYLENLKIFKTFNKKDSIYRLYRTEKTLDMPDLAYSYSNNSPEWINRIPEITGYSFSIGVSGRYSRISDSVKNADASALEEMIKQKNITVYSDTGYNNSSFTGLKYASSELKGFYIIRRWWSADLENFYSLGIIKNK